jgi:uncharacterized NAD(P)/FAD-binding protein YdhS
MKHTKGNWMKGANTSNKEWMQIFSDGKLIAEVKPLSKKGERKETDFAEEEANAKLIAAAPDLLEAIQQLLKEARANSFNLNQNINDTPAEDRAAQAIRKAIGQ